MEAGDTLNRPPSGFSRWALLSFQNRSIAASSGLTYRPHIRGWYRLLWAVLDGGDFLSETVMILKSCSDVR